MKGAFWVLAWALLSLSSSGETRAAEISAELALRVSEEGSVPLWVNFADKAESDPPSSLPEHLSARALDRRAKVRSADALTDWRDLPLRREYLSFFESRGWKLRARSRWLNAVSLDADPSMLAILAEQPFVKSLTPVAGSLRSESLPTAPALPSGAARDTMIDYGLSESELAQIAVPSAHAAGYKGQGVIIGMLDTGCSTMHEALQGVDILGTWDFIQDDEIIADQPGDVPEQDHHGSRTFSTLAANLPGSLVGVAFEASYYLAKTEQEASEEPVEEDYWVAGLEWLEAMGCDIVNSSVGYKDWYTYEDLDGDTAVSTVAADHAASLGLLVVAAVGNERYDFGHMIAPSDGDSVLAVGAVTPDGGYSWFSSPGPTYDGRIKPDVMARGEENYTIDPASWSGYLEVSGTSYCTALTSGVAALVLCANPGIGPMEIVEALRMTGDHATVPDNDYGWGIVNALDAIEYFKPSIDHDPLPDSEDSDYGYPVTAEITTIQGAITEAEVLYRINGGGWSGLILDPLGEDLYGATLPAQAWGSTVDYYLRAANEGGHEARHPAGAPEVHHSFNVDEDLLPPAIDHVPLGDQAMPLWPATVKAEVIDNLGLASVLCESWLNGDRQDDFELADMGGDDFEGQFPYTVAEGDSVRYRIVATDAAQAGNQSTHPTYGEHVFGIRGGGGLVLLLVDGESFRDCGGKPGPDKQWMPAPPDCGRSDSADWIMEALNDAGYLVQRENLGGIDPGLWTSYDLLVICSSERTDPLNVEGVPEALESYGAAGGRLLCEGGELAYKFREDSSFLNDVLHVSGWLADYGGDLELRAPEHPVANYPFDLPMELPFSYEYYTDQDVVAPASDAVLVYGTEAHPWSGGIVVHDMDPDPLGGQSVFLPFNLGRLPEQEAKQLVRNSAAWLLAGFTSGSGVVSGQIVLPDAGDYSDVTVTLTGQDPWITGPDGQFLFENVWEGNVLLRAEKDGYARVDSVLMLGEGQVIENLLIELQPVLILDYLSQPELPIPDNFPPGVYDTIWIQEPGSLLDLTVDIDISHSYVGDLVVKLISPSGTHVTLHNRSGGPSDDIVGTYPITLIPAESLDILQGESVSGPWRMRVADYAYDDVGVLHSWGLHIAMPVLSTSAELPPAVFELSGNWPNPFNPSTSLAFSLSDPARTRLDIFDIRGRRLATLLDESLAAGTYSVVWHGTDQKGRALSSGVYFARLRSGEREAVHKMLLLK